MKIEKSIVHKILIYDLENRDNISVYLEDFGIGRGKITITCVNESWSYGWSAMGNHNMTSFFSSCDDDYLICKLDGGIQHYIFDDDPGVNVKHLRKHILNKRREGMLFKSEARELYEDVQFIDDEYDKIDRRLYERLFGSWYYDLPEKINPKYEYLKKIVGIVKEALKSGV